MPISATDLNKAYLAYFGRPADLTGKTYFATLEQADVIKAFDASAESKALYGNDAAAKVNAIYQNLFNRNAEPEGLVYWTTLINQGRVTAAGAAFAILNGAQGTDATAVQNKLAASEAFVAAMDTTTELVGYSGLDAAASARNWLKGVTSDAASLTAAVAGAQAAVTAAVEAGTGEGGAGYQLTNGTDVASSNVFTAGLVYTPGGDDRINSLQDEDRLTGTGTNATLNATLGNANDNGGTTIAPTLKNIQTLNINFVGSDTAGTVSNGAVTTLDLQDATGVQNINVGRISAGAGATAVNLVNIVDNGTNNLSIDNVAVPTEVNFDYQDGALAGTADAGTLTLKGVNLNAVSINNNAAGPASPNLEGFETLNLVSADGANTLRKLNATQLNVLNISGTKALTLANQTTEAERVVVNAPAIVNDGAGAYVLSTIDASTLGAALTIDLSGHTGVQTSPQASGVVSYLKVTGSASADTFIINEGTADSGLAIAGGAGNDTLKLYANLTDVITTTTKAAITQVENLEVRSQGGIITVDTNLITDLATLLVRNESASAKTFTLNHLSAAAAGAINVHHSVTGANAVGDTTVTANLADASGAADTVVFNLVTDLNTLSRFNATFNALGEAPTPLPTGKFANNYLVENVTINDTDNESNTISLASAGTNLGTITLKGGVAGQFLNLDSGATAAGGLYGYNVSNSSAADAKFVTDVGGGAQNRLVAAVIDASAEVSNVTVRVSTSNQVNAAGALEATAMGAQKITMGAGNDTVIFDNLNDNRAGLTISDTVVGGEGTDTLVIDGNVVGGTIALSASEWTNVSGFENIRLVNAGAGSNYSLVLTDALIAANKDAAGFLNIINDHDSVNDTANAADAVNGAANRESAVTIDARTLSANSRFTYNGEEGGSATNDRFILSDANINGGNVINGGAANNISTAGNNGANGDVLEVRNAAVVTVGDLANVSNVGRISFNNDLAIAQTLNLQLNDDVVDAMVDSFHASTLVNPERLTVIARDGTIASVAGAALVIDASAATGRSVLTITSDAGLLTAVADTITVASIVGNTAAHNIDIADGAGTADTLTFVGAAGEAFAATTTVAVAGTANTANLVIQNAAGLATVTHTVQWDNVDTINLNAGGVTTSFAAAAVNATFNGSAGADTIIGTAGANTINAGTGADTVTGGAGVDTIDLGVDVVADLISFTGVNAAANRDVVTNFTVGTDVLGLDADFTTAATAVGVAAAVEDEAAAAANANGAAYNIGALTAGNTNALDLVTLDVTTLTNTANANLALATDGTELLKALVAAGAGNTASGIQMDNVGDSIYIATRQGGNGYLYLASAGADNLATANEIVLVGTFTGSLLDSVVAAQTLMVA